MDLDLGGPQKRGPVKSGRRARTSSKASFNTNEKGASPPQLPKPMPTSDADVRKNSPARPSRRMGGWGDTAKRDAVEDSRLFSDAKTRLESDDDVGTPDIEMIPDEDDFMVRIFSNTVMVAFYELFDFLH